MPDCGWCTERYLNCMVMTASMSQKDRKTRPLRAALCGIMARAAECEKKAVKASVSRLIFAMKKRMLVEPAWTTFSASFWHSGWDWLKVRGLFKHVMIHRFAKPYA